MSPRKKNSPEKRIRATVCEWGIRVDVKERKGTASLQLEAHVVDGTARTRPRVSARTADLDLATERARQFAAELAAQLGYGPEHLLDWLAVRGSELTIGEVFDAYFSAKGTMYRNGQVRSAANIFEQLWGRDLRLVDIDQHLIDEFVKDRAAGKYKMLVHGRLISRNTGGPTTVRHNLIVLGTIFRWLMGVRHRGKRILTNNPLDGLRLPPPDPNMRQPVADERRFQLYLRYAPRLQIRLEVDYRRCNRSWSIPEGAYALFLQVLRWTGKRAGAVRKLRHSDLLLTYDQMRCALAVAGWKHEEAWADHWPHGAIRWDKENDKKDFTRITPISGRLRSAIDCFLTTNGEQHPDAWIFPEPPHPERSFSPGSAARYLNLLEKMIHADGITLPKLARGQYHPFRRLWRSERAGFFDAKLVAIVGGWSTTGGDVMDHGYLQFLPVAMYLCAEFDPTQHLTEALPVPGVMVPGLATAVLGTKTVQEVLRHNRGHIGS